MVLAGRNLAKYMEHADRFARTGRDEEVVEGVQSVADGRDDGEILGRRERDRGRM